jgi:hypothetical protein
MDTLEYRLHAGAKSSLTILAVLCFILCVAAPIAIWVLIRSRSALVRISPTDVEAKGLFSGTEFQFADIERLGLHEAPIVARGIGGALVRKRFDGNKIINIVVKTRAGKTCKLGVSQYENWRDIITKIGERARRPYEQMQTGLLGMKWPGE